MSLHCPPAQYQLDPTDDDLYLEPGTSYGHSRSPSATTRRKAKPERACDLCRRRKTKCDGPLMSNGVCTSCHQNKQSCTYVETSKPRGPPKAYVTALEDRMEKMEALLTRLRPETDLIAELGPAVVRDSWKDGDDSQEKSRSPARGQRASSGTPKKPAKTILPLCLPLDRDANMSDVSDESDDIVLHGPLSGKTPKLPIVASTASSPMDRPGTRSFPIVDAGHSFFGKSSTIMLVDAAWQLKDAHADEIRTPSSAGVLDDGESSASSVSFREEFWVTPEWEMNWVDSMSSGSPEDALSYILGLLPPDDLAASLTDIFFTRVNIHWPYLHRPTFERQRAQGLHERDVWFAFLCASVFAVASRYSNDERVLYERPVPNDSSTSDSNAPTKWHLAGWHWYEAVMHFAKERIDLTAPVGLFEVQTLISLSTYLIGTEYEAAAWLYVSIGLRMVQEVGAHRQQMYSRGSNQVEEELWRRAFWVLIVHDRLLSAYLGRDCSAREEDFDVHLPAEVDDEYWLGSASNQAFKQPPGRPSVVTAFNAMIRLSSIAAYAVRTVCTTERSRNVHLPGDQDSDWRTVAVKELNAAFTEWAKTVPEHLRLSSTVKDTIFFYQSASLFSLYYGLQILIYRPFVAPACTWALPPSASPDACTSLEKHAHPHMNFPFPASAICRTAARAFTHFAADLVQCEMHVTPMLLAVAQLSAAVMVSHAWEVKVRNLAAGVPEDTARYAVEKAVGEAQTVMRIFEVAQGRWAYAGIVLQKLSSSLPSPEDEVRLPYALPSEVFPPSSGSSEPELSPDLHTASSTSSQIWTPPLSSYGSTATELAEPIKTEPGCEDLYPRYESQDQKPNPHTSAQSFMGEPSPYIHSYGDSKNPHMHYQPAVYSTSFADAGMYMYPPHIPGQASNKRARTSVYHPRDYQAYPMYDDAAPPYAHRNPSPSIALPSPVDMAHLDFGFDTRPAGSHAEDAWSSPYASSRGYANSQGYMSGTDLASNAMETYRDAMMDGSEYYGY